MGMRLHDPFWFIDRSAPSMERVIKAGHDRRERLMKGYLERRDCPDCGKPIPQNVRHCDKRGCLVGVIPGCRECGWSPTISGSNIMVPNPRYGFKLKFLEQEVE